MLTPLFEKLRPEIEGDEFEKHPLHCFIFLYGGLDSLAILSELATYFIQPCLV